MTTTQILILLITGLLAGFVSGAMGVGGGIIIVPALVFLLGMSQHEAQGTSLGVLAFPVVLLGAINYYKNGYLNIKFVLFLVLAFFIGGYLGSATAIALPDKLLRKIFGGMIFIASLKMIFGK
ncbi:MAG TPA: sulfite exporter TauE/SafE family protein [Bacteroidetes bacterium]|nr:sulfite exporter TauE/SafE family protein [Bacteroidota bacterium]